MRSCLVLAFLAAQLLVCPSAGGEEAARNRIPWQPYEPSTFEGAARDQRLLLVVVSTQWCHWCHVMQRETYADAEVERLIQRHFMPIKVDADQRPDLAERFRNYRWPATGFFTPEGVPILALRGYRSPGEFRQILEDVRGRWKAGGPYPGLDSPSAPPAQSASAGRHGLLELRQRLVQQLNATYDLAHQGWGRGQKYPLFDPIVWGLLRAQVEPTDSQPLRRAMDSLAAGDRLLDPVFGGMFQYSVGPDWNDPHYEKIMGVNAGALEAYSLAYARWGNPRWLRSAQQVHRWFERFMSAADGAFFASQDAEVNGREATAYHRLSAPERLRVGVPRVDRSVYARENGQAIQAYVAYAAAAREPGALKRAQVAAERIWATHFDADARLFRHAAHDRTAPWFLLDQAEMGLALLELSQETGERIWAERAARLAEGVLARFSAQDGALRDVAEAKALPGLLGTELRSLEANAKAARFLLRAAAHLERPPLRDAALRALVAVGVPGFAAAHWRHVGALLRAVEEALAPVTVATLFAGDEALGQWLPVLREARRADFTLHVRRAPPSAQGTFVVLCSPDGACSDPLETPQALLQGLRGASLGAWAQAPR